MNATEAKRVITKYSDLHYSAGYEPDYEIGQAEGYLKALEGPEVKALMEALEQTIHRLKFLGHSDSDKWDKILAQYYAAVKK